MNDLLERGFAAQMKDVREMPLIEALSYSGVPPDYACSSVVGGELKFKLSKFVKDTLSAPALLGCSVVESK